MGEPAPGPKCDLRLSAGVEYRCRFLPTVVGELDPTPLRDRRFRRNDLEQHAHATLQRDPDRSDGVRLRDGYGAVGAQRRSDRCHQVRIRDREEKGEVNTDAQPGDLALPGGTRRAAARGTRVHKEQRVDLDVRRHGEEGDDLIRHGFPAALHDADFDRGGKGLDAGNERDERDGKQPADSHERFAPFVHGLAFTRSFPGTTCWITSAGPKRDRLMGCGV